jgi:hypothetical protein
MTMFSRMATPAGRAAVPDTTVSEGQNPALAARAWVTRSRMWPISENGMVVWNSP